MTDTKPYPEYKESGIPWLGDVPTHWKVVRLKEVCGFEYGDSLPEEQRTSIGVPVYGSNGLIGYTHTPNTKSNCLVIGRKGSSGKVIYSEEAGFAIDTTFFVDQRHTNSSTKWLYYLLTNLDLESLSGDVGVPGLNRTRAYQQNCLLPPLYEQAAIVRYLDDADQHIQAYVSAKERLIALLEEERQAVIHQAVTRGLDPNVRLKPSGVEWLGDVPEHWETLRVGQFSEVGNGSTPSRGNAAYWTDGVHPWLNSSSVNQGIITRADQFVTDLALRECHLPNLHSGNVLVGITGEGRTRGMSAVLDIDATINQHMAFITPKTTRASSYFLQICLTAAYGELRTISSASGSTKAALTCEDIKHFIIVLPPRDEQERLLKQVRCELARVDNAILRARQQIKLLEEYRTRLIADVVTGKLDVRDTDTNLPSEQVT